MQQNTIPPIDIGSSVRRKMSEHGTSISWLAKQINCDRSNLRKHLYKEQIYPELLQKICIALKTNFFEEYVEWYMKALSK